MTATSLDCPNEESIRVLAIEGFCSVPWMEKRCARASGERFVENNPDDGRVDWSQVEPAWKNVVLNRIDCFSRQEDFSRTVDSAKVEECKAEIATGMYHAMLVVDLTKDCKEFEKLFGSTLQKFTKDGGVAAFPTSEFRLIPTLNNLFSTSYQTGDYLDTKWEPCLENSEMVARSFARGNLSEEKVMQECNFETSCVCLMNVPPKERCFGITATERSKMMDPTYGAANDKGIMAAKDPEIAGYPVCVAVHDYGDGCVGYFGDQNCVETTLRLIASFLLSRAPDEPVDSFSRLEKSTFGQVLTCKAKGNEFFSASSYEDAIGCYDEALSLYGTKAGKQGDQRKEHVALWSNRAECCLRLKRYSEAEESCTKALEIEGSHGKSLLRRAKARLYQSQKSGMHEIRLLQEAESDILKIDSANESKATRDVLDSIQTRLKSARKKQKDSFKAGFSSAVGKE